MSRSSLIQLKTTSAEKKEALKLFTTEGPVWWQSWEFYLIALLAIVLRLYRIDTAQYMSDHNIFYQMAHDALANGLWPISGNQSSTGPLIPPLFIYVMMIPAAITSNPIAGNIFVALCNIAAVLLTYIFVRRYFGRLAGAFSALLYATAVNVIVFSRDIWQPNLLPLLIILLLFLLFRGTIEQKRYWFLPSMLLFGIMYQFHNTAIYLLAPFLVAIILSLKFVRWSEDDKAGWALTSKTILIRELPLALLGLIVLFIPYIYLERHNGYDDIIWLFRVVIQPTHTDFKAIQLYKVFMQSFVFNPLGQNVDTHLIPSNEHSILLTTPLHFISSFIPLESQLMELLLVGGMISAFVLILWPGRLLQRRKLLSWLQGLLASPQRKGLLILLVWQAMVFMMLHHPVELYIHYLLYLLPGPFILVGLLLANVAKLAQRLRPSWELVVRCGLCATVGLIVALQTLTSAAWLIDHARGNFNSNFAAPEYFDLATVERIVDTVDQVAQQQHLSRAYIDIRGDDETSVRYLAQFAHTQMAVFGAGQCLTLPSAASGPVVYVTDSNRPDIDALLQNYTTLQQVKEISHPGGAPLKVYVLSAKPEPRPALQLSGNMQLLSSQADILSNPRGTSQWLATRWKIQNEQLPQERTTYHYAFSYQPEKQTMGGQQPFCALSRTWAGDQLISFFDFNGSNPQHLATQIQTFSVGPKHYDWYKLKLVTFYTSDTPYITLSDHGRKIINLSVPAAQHKGSASH